MGSSDTDLTLSRWVSPCRPLTAMTPPSGGLSCSAKSSTSDGLSCGGDSSSPMNCLPSIVSETSLSHPRDAPAFQYGSLRSRHFPTPMTKGSGGLVGGGGTPRPLACHLDNDPYLIYCRLYKHALADDDSSEDEASGDSSEIQQSFSFDSSPVFFPCKMEGEQWEVVVAEAERKINEEGYPWDDTNDDGPKRP